MKKEPIEFVSERNEALLRENNPLIKEKSIIVLPFENISSDPDQEYFSDGLTEEIINDLTHIHDLLVISRSSAMTFKGSKRKIKDIACDVNVKYVLEGSVRKDGNNLRITAQLIDGMNDTHLWAEKYKGTLDDIFDIQEKVARSIADALKIRITSVEKEKIHERPIDNALAYDCYLRAYQEIMSWKKERLELGLELLQKGIEITGENAIIYAGMAFAHFQFVNMGIDQELNAIKSEEFVIKALTLDPELAEAHFVYANICFVIYSKTKEAIIHFHRANSNKPDNPEFMVWLSWSYYIVGKTDKAVELMRRCSKIDPLNPLYDLCIKGLGNFMNGRFKESLNPLLELNKFYVDASMWQLWKVLALFYNNKLTETYEFLNETVKEPWQDSITALLIFLKYSLEGNKEKATLLLTPELTKVLKSDCQYSWHMAAIYSYLGEKEKSLEWIENAVDRGFIHYFMLNNYDILLDKIRSEERFKKLMVRVKYEWENFEV